ncbi:hypothetical protein [Sphaerotilus sp.]|uniref:hypothetical protein n=1 Tax=Sphaerotilus sp. TaxID=2093942 RepID=UPI0034E2D668
MIHRWIHRRAVLAWLLLPWLALLLTAIGLIAIDLTLGDRVTAQDWALRIHPEWLWQSMADLPLLMAGLYACGSVAWTLGLLMGGRSARRASLVLGLLCGGGGVLVGLAWYQPASLVLGSVALVTGGLYAALTHRPQLRVQRRQTRVPAAPPAPPPEPVAPARPPTAPPVPTLIRHEPPTTQPVEY